jgi:hypothetical protein
MDLAEHYNKLHNDSISKIANCKYEIYHLTDYDDDNRFGVTLAIRPDAATNYNIQQFLGEAMAIDPSQYYYQNAYIHINLTSIISCCDGFDLNNINVQEFRRY